ncbi:MAG: hypothetical protein AAFR17_13195 [Pseudomonadota bacterium]
MVTIAQLTQDTAEERLREDGAAALGLTAPLFSPVWFTEAPQFDTDALTMTPGGGMNSTVQVPFLGILETIDVPNDVFDVSGQPINQPITRIRLHPHAGARLTTLARKRYAGDGTLYHPVATQVVIRDVTEDPRSPTWVEPGDPLGLLGAVSLHDKRGLIVCPVAVAAMYADLLSTYPALFSLSEIAPDQEASVEDPGGLQSLAGLAGEDSIAVHVVDPHGAAFVSVGSEMTRRNGDDVEETLGASPITLLGDGESFRSSDADEAADTAAAADDAHDFVTGSRLRWGWSNGGRLAREALEAPSLESDTLGRQFLRLTVVDLKWHLLGNRGTDPVQEIDGDDGLIPEVYQPHVRPDLPIDYLSDGVATLAAARDVIERVTVEEPADEFILAVSPTLSQSVPLPPERDTAGRWPAWPGGGNAGFDMPAASPAGEMTATLSGGNNVVVTLAANSVPDGAHVRVYPRQFVEIVAIAEQPSFLRGNGGAALAVADEPTQVYLVDPLNTGGPPPPGDAVLTLDLAVTSRTDQRQLWSSIALPLQAGDAPVPESSFTEGAGLLPAINNFSSIAPSPLFGLANPEAPPPADPEDPPAGLPEIARRLINEQSPRIGPRLPGQARFETMIITGAGEGGGPLAWEAVITGGRWDPETLSTRHRDGNPGNPAGPDIHAAGVKVGGDLALDAARCAARRVQGILPVGEDAFGWVAIQGGDNFNRPGVMPDNAATQANAGAGALLKTVAAYTETPEFGPTLFDLPDIPVDAQSMIYTPILAGIGSALGLGGPPAFDIEIGNEDRLGSELVKEIYHARHGARDALWALRRALGQARELVYIEGPQFARTSPPPEDFEGQPPAHAVDLVEVLAARMTAMPSLHVVICVPREGDFAPIYRGWVRQAISARLDAANALSALHPDRVAVFHPKGFPGRHAAIRSTSVIVDDCWALVGTSHLRRRGMTFDGAADIVSMPYGLSDASATNLATFRRELMARKLGLEPERANDRQTAEWVRLAEMRSSFSVFSDLLAQGGAGKIAPLWSGPSDDAVAVASRDMADPDGTSAASILELYLNNLFLLDETGDGP